MAALFIDERREAGQPATRRDPADARAGADQGRAVSRLSFCVPTTGRRGLTEMAMREDAPADIARPACVRLRVRDMANVRMPKADPHRCLRGGGGTAG